MLVQVIEFSVKRGNGPVVGPISFCLNKGAAIAVAGASGSGKTTLLEAIAGGLFFSGKLEIVPGVKVAFIPQQHQFKNLSNTQTFYYQQRYNSIDADDSPTVADALPELFSTGIKESADVAYLLDLFNLADLKNRRLLHLSNGENKRLQIARALLHKPNLLLLDNPFTGLDIVARNVLESCVNQLLQSGMAIIITCSPSKIPSFVHQVLELKPGSAGVVHTAECYAAQSKELAGFSIDTKLMETLFADANAMVFQNAVKMVDVQVRYGNVQVLSNINWQVRKGERWSISGPNGAGKSTLLSLINADNPQAYANEIYLFDKRRGAGETIWDIKKSIGYVSPELHLYFDRGASVFDTVASGFFDTIGLFRSVSARQDMLVRKWLQLLGLEGQINRLLWQLPLGTQRLILLARALVKCPSLLILDEPLQGMDDDQAATFTSIINAICAQTDQTLIFVSHYTEDLPACITHFLRLEKGTVK